jgi:lipid II:glycine glycyltransferase (peptidoglycan interpeptide bridge formation enzyme)
MAEISLSEWNIFLSQHPNAHLLQSGEWGELKSAFGWESVRVVEGATGAQILFRPLPLGYTFAYLPKGPLSELEPEPGFWSAVDRACRCRRAVFLKIETDGWEDNRGPEFESQSLFVLSPQHIQPHSTLVINLQNNEGELFNNMKPKTRYNIRLAGRKEVVVRSSDDIENFYSMMNITSKRQQFHVHSIDYYRLAYELFHPTGLCELFVAEFQGRALAALMVFAYGKKAYYFYGASTDEERNRKPTYPLQWEAIRWARQKGCIEYDMWGIPDDVTKSTEDEESEREDGLWGVYRFKRGFGGVIRHAHPAMDRVYIPLLYKLYRWRFSSSGAD